MERPTVQKSDQKQKMIIIVGPTASGKSSLAVRLAQKFAGEIISADSRQVYRGLDIGTEKITSEEMGGIPHHLINVSDADQTFTASLFKNLAEQKINDLVSREKLPIVVGGTGFYIETLLGTVPLPKVQPNQKLREELEHKSVEELFAELQEKDPGRADTIDPHNKRRLMRALEIVGALGAVPKRSSAPTQYRVLKLGLTFSDKELRKKIELRLKEALDRGLIQETESLVKTLSQKRIDELGLEYRIISRYLRGEISKEEMIELLILDVWHYAKRQMTWFKRDKEIIWFSPDEYTKIEKVVADFIAA